MWGRLFVKNSQSFEGKATAHLIGDILVEKLTTIIDEKSKHQCNPLIDDIKIKNQGGL